MDDIGQWPMHIEVNCYETVGYEVFIGRKIKRLQRGYRHISASQITCKTQHFSAKPAIIDHTQTFGAAVVREPFVGVKWVGRDQDSPSQIVALERQMPVASAS